MTRYLTSFYPLCCTAKGRKAIEDNPELRPYIDGSCRREPDFENEYPCITGLCRPGFAQKLKKNDIIVYVTNKRGVRSRMVVAGLKVIEVFDNHVNTAKWYTIHGKVLPNNIMVPQTKPFDLNKTHQKIGWDSWMKGASTLEEWDNCYLARANSEFSSKVAQCAIIFRRLENPIDLDDNDWREISNRPLCSQNPPILTDPEWILLKEKINLLFDE
jgi:hypothetical protein